MAYETVWEDGGIYWKYSGLVNGEEILEASTKIYGDRRFDEIDYKLVDFIDVEDISISIEQVSLIAFQHKAAEQINPLVRTAIVISFKCDLAEKFAAFFKDSKWEVELFETVDEANKFLGRLESF